jgi:hypothetical protein
MSLECSQKANITLWATNIMYSISTPRGQVVADHMVHKIPLELAGRAFSTSLIILEGEGIDVILGMNRMKLHKAVMDISTRLVQLDPPQFWQDFSAIATCCSSPGICSRCHCNESQ